MRRLLPVLLVLVLAVTSPLTIVPEVKALPGAASFSASGAASWTNIATTGPPSRYGAGMVYDAADGYVLLFGGCCTGNPYLGDTWKFSAGAWTKLDIPGPSARFLDAGMVYDAADGYVLLFGGEDASPGRWLGDTWKFSAGAWTKLDISGPSARDDYGMAYDASDGYVVLSGGVLTSDTWKFSAGSWTNLAIPSPSQAHDQFDMVYDAADGYVVLFGGIDSNNPTANPTWKFSAGTWTKLDIPGPVARWQLDMAYDAADGYVVLFGGFKLTSSNTYLTLGDTWKFAGGTWANLTIAGPPPRRDEGLAYDAADSYVVLFGGLSSGQGYLGDTWKFSGPAVPPTDTSSTAVACTSPVVVNHVTSCFAVVTDTASGPTTPTGTVTLTPGGTCTLAPVPGTTSSASCLVGITPTASGSLSVSASYGGDSTHAASSGQFLIMVSPGVVFTVSSNPTVNSPVTFTATVTGATAPYSFSWDLGDGSVLGTSNPVTHTYTTTGAETVSVTVTDSASATAMASQTINVGGVPLSASFTVSANPTVGTAVTFTATVTGGTAPYTFSWDFGDGSAAGTGNPVTHTYTTNGAKTVTLSTTDASSGSTILSDAWEFKAGTWTQLSSSSSPSPRFVASMTYDEADGYVLLFGGSNNIGGTSPLGDTWEFNAGVWTQLSPSTSPSPRVLASMVYDVADGYVLLFGGLDGNLYPLGDTWKFQAGTWTQLFPSSTPSSGFGSAVYDAADGYVLLFGPGFTTLADTWEFHAGTWTQLFPSSSPSPRVAASMAYDVADGQVLLFGGSDLTSPNTPLGDTWEFQAGTWTQLSPSTSPSPRFASMAYDVADGYILLFGGSPQSDTWEFLAGVWTQLTPSSSPSPRTAASMVYDVADGSALLFGGVGPSGPIQSITNISVTGTIGTAQASQNLINVVKSLHLSSIAQTSLLGPLTNIVKILSDQNPTNDISACGRLSSFINAVENDQRKGILTMEQADQLRQLATSIMVQLGC